MPEHDTNTTTHWRLRGAQSDVTDAYYMKLILLTPTSPSLLPSHRCLPPASRRSTIYHSCYLLCYLSSSSSHSPSLTSSFYSSSSSCNTKEETPSQTSLDICTTHASLKIFLPPPASVRPPRYHTVILISYLSYHPRPLLSPGKPVFSGDHVRFR